MPHDPKKVLCDAVGRDLRILSEILDNHILTKAGSRQLMTASFGLHQSRQNREVLLLELSDVDIWIDRRQRFKPSSVALEDRLLADIIFEQDLERACNGQEIDSINRNSIQLKLRATATARTSTRELVSAWHFDRHNYPGTQSNACHPTYHWQFGGWGLKNLSEDIRGVLVTDSPRLFAPPMDLVLAIDFLISHYNGPEWNRIRMSEPRYIDAVKNSQERIWKPYFSAINKFLASSKLSNPSRAKLDLLPNLV